MKHDRVMSFQKPRDLFCQKHHRHACAQHRRNNCRQVRCSDVFHKRRIEPKRHQKRRKTHSGRNDAERHTKAAEQISKKPLRNRNADPAHETQKDQYRKKRPRQRIQIPPAPSFFSCLPKHRRQHSDDQPDKQAHRQNFIACQEKSDRTRREQKSARCPQEHRKQKSAVL